MGLGTDFINFVHMEAYLIYRVSPLSPVVLIPICILISSLCYQHLIYIHLPASEELL